MHYVGVTSSIKNDNERAFKANDGFVGNPFLRTTLQDFSNCDGNVERRLCQNDFLVSNEGNLCGLHAAKGGIILYPAVPLFLFQENLRV